jgi:carboxynorspermidine decarboxylase
MNRKRNPLLDTPYYLIDQNLLLRNLAIIQRVRRQSGARVLLALKCFAAWSVFDLMREYMDGTTSSSLYELRLGREKFGGETHAYSVAFADHEIDEVVSHADKIIFNSLGQLTRFREQTAALRRGLRINPGISSSTFDLADPARPFSRLGETDAGRIAEALDHIDGLMIHNNCENADFASFSSLLDQIERQFGDMLSQVEWVSLGGGIHFTAEDYPLDAFCARLKAFSQKYGVQLYLEPGEAAITNSTTLEVTVLDIMENGKPIAIVDASVEAHMLDLLIYRQQADIAPDTGPHRYLVCGKSCLAGDVFGEFRFEHELKPGDRISIRDAGGYTMVKKNWFNGVRMPSIAVRERNGELRLVREFTFEDYVSSLS